MSSGLKSGKTGTETAPYPEIAKNEMAQLD